MEDATARLATEEIVWLTTVRTDGQPQTSPVWFVWRHGTAFIVSAPGAGKLANLGGNPHVSLHLEGAGPGELVVTLEGVASTSEGLPDDVAAAYAAKYGAGMARLGTSAEEYFASFSTGIRIAPIRWRAFPSGLNLLGLTP